jgi:hypothetical protein
MTESDLRVANTRLQSGGEVTPYTARHMGLFVVGRLAQQHGLVVRLRSTIAGEANSGTTAGVYVPSELLQRAGMRDQLDTGPKSTPTDVHSGMATAMGLYDVDIDYSDYSDDAAYGDEVGVDQLNGHSELPVTLLPQRSPGASGIAGSPAEDDLAQQSEADEAEYEYEPAVEYDQEEAWEEPAAEQSPQAPVDTSAFFASRGQVATNGTNGTNGAHEREEESSETAGAEDAIYQRMLSEWLVDPSDLANSTDLNWESVWDHGWSAAEAAEDAPVEAHTEHGLPMRDPGARLVPGAAAHSNGGAHRSHEDDDEVESAAEFSTGAHAIPVRDPDAVRASMSSHFGGVHAARSHAQETRGTDNE